MFCGRRWGSTGGFNYPGLPLPLFPFLIRWKAKNNEGRCHKVGFALFNVYGCRSNYFSLESVMC